MSKTLPIAKAAADDAAVSADVVTVSLTEFCTRLSDTDKRPELIGAFESDEIRAGRRRDTAQQFRERYSAFINKPV